MMGFGGLDRHAVADGYAGLGACVECFPPPPTSSLDVLSPPSLSGSNLSGGHLVLVTRCSARLIAGGRVPA